MYQIPLPEKFQQMTDAEALALIAQRKQELHDKIVILGHHYQRDEIVQFADFTGDSLELSQQAAGQKAEYIVFCGVHFMAESADILTSPDQKVLLPDMTAGCSMADMAAIDQVEDGWQNLQQRLGHPGDLVPICYVNSSAAIKAFCGRNGGLSCTSSNCRAIFESVWTRNPRAVILFMPDEHLGRNTGYAMGIPLEAMPLWDPYQPSGGIHPAALRHPKIILWKGFCSVHQEFTVEQIDHARRAHPEVKVIVHPECCFAVTQKADLIGSTAFIIKAIRAAEPGSYWAVGTEINLVNRLTAEMAQRKVDVCSLNKYSSADKPRCLCETMYRIDPRHLAWLLDTLKNHLANPGQVKLMNRVQVDPQTRRDARLALDRMLQITANSK